MMTLFVWAAAAASIAFWVLQWPQPEALRAATVPVISTSISSEFSQSMSRALGLQARPLANAPSQSNSQYQLIGVIASASGQGSALIATDGLPPKAYRVGQAVQEGWTLVSLTSRQARLRSSGRDVLLELPQDKKP